MRISQPALTRTVAHLEPELGVRLFDRTTRRVQVGTLLAFVAAGVGLGIVPRGAVRGPLGHRLRVVPLEPRLMRRIGLIALREREPTPAASGLIALLKQEWSQSD